MFIFGMMQFIDVARSDFCVVQTGTVCFQD